MPIGSRYLGIYRRGRFVEASDPLCVDVERGQYLPIEGSTRPRRMSDGDEVRFRLGGTATDPVAEDVKKT